MGMLNVEPKAVARSLGIFGATVYPVGVLEMVVVEAAYEGVDLLPSRRQKPPLPYADRHEYHSFEPVSVHMAKFEIDTSVHGAPSAHMIFTGPR